jgi:hypothetical protein
VSSGAVSGRPLARSCLPRVLLNIAVVCIALAMAMCPWYSLARHEVELGRSEAVAEQLQGQTVQLQGEVAALTSQVHAAQTQLLSAQSQLQAASRVYDELRVAKSDAEMRRDAAMAQATVLQREIAELRLQFDAEARRYASTLHHAYRSAITSHVMCLSSLLSLTFSRPLLRVRTLHVQSRGGEPATHAGAAGNVAYQGQGVCAFARRADGNHSDGCPARERAGGEPPAADRGVRCRQGGVRGQSAQHPAAAGSREPQLHQQCVAVAVRPRRCF